MSNDKITLSQLEQYLSKAAWIFKGPVDASDQIRVGRAQNFLEHQIIQQIYNWYQNYQDVENYVKVASMAELEEKILTLTFHPALKKIIEDDLHSVEEAIVY